jgi:hypothetical protein
MMYVYEKLAVGYGIYICMYIYVHICMFIFICLYIFGKLTLGYPYLLWWFHDRV